MGSARDFFNALKMGWFNGKLIYNKEFGEFGWSSKI
jgi:hypothetical protein